MAVIDNRVPARLRGEGVVWTAGTLGPGTHAKGSAPASTPDLDEIGRLVQQGLPQVRWIQLPVMHASDDDGLWFFWLPDVAGEVQIESSVATCPFTIETDKHDDRVVAESPREVADTVLRWLNLSGGRAASPWHPR